MNKYNHKYLRDWAKQQGIPMPKHLMIVPLTNGAEGAYTVLAFSSGDGYQERVDCLQALRHTAKQQGFYTREGYKDDFCTSITIDFVGKLGAVSRLH